MATDDRPPSGPLILGLLARPQDYNLFQAISLLERAVPGAAPIGASDGVHPEALRFRAHISLGFAPSDVAAVRKDAEPDGEPFTLHTAVLALAGANGPLPLTFTESLLECSARGDHASSDFLDIFHHRFLSFLYRSRKKHRLGLNWRSPTESALASMLDAVGALGVRCGLDAEGAWLRHAGLLGGAPRSMSGLLQLLRDRTGLQIHGRQFAGGWRPLEDHGRLRLGARHGPAQGLGRGAALGGRWWDPASGISLRFVQLTRPRLEALLPGGTTHVLIARLVRRYMQHEMDVDVTVETAEATDRGACPSVGAPMRLGWTSWLGKRADTAVRSSTFRLSMPLF